MILFCGIPSESPLSLAVAAAEEMGLEHLLFDQRHASFFDLELDLDGGRLRGSLWVNGREWPLDAFTGVYTRLIDPSLPADRRRDNGLGRDPAAAARAVFVTRTLAEWLEVAGCRVLNRAWAMATNCSKPHQARIIAESGLLTPATVVTNEPDEVADLARRHGRIVYKSTSAVRSIVKEWTADGAPPLSRLRHLPTQFQEYVPGVNVRVHVVGGELFATAVTTDAVDYRYASRDDLEVDMAEVRLPADVAAKCLALSRRLSLPFCGIDLKRTPDDRFYCFEVNPSPAYSYYETRTGQAISQALVRYLAGVTD